VTPLDLAGLSTRGELLRRADEGIGRSDRALSSARRALPVLMWSVGLLVMLFVQGGADLDSGDSSFAFLPALVILWWLVAKIVPGKAFIGHVVAAIVVLIVGSVTTPMIEDLDGAAARTFFLSVWAVVAAGTAWTSWTYITAGRRLLAQIDTWRAVRRDPGLRDLADHDVTPDVATVHDLRDRADYDEAVDQVVARHQGRLYDLRTLQPTFVLMPTGVLGLVFFLAPLVGLDDSAWAPASSVSGLLLLAPWAWAAVVDMNRAIHGRQTEANRVLAERHLYAVRRHHTTGAAIGTARRRSLLGTSAGLLLLAAWIAVLAVRLRTSEGTPIVIALSLVLIGAVVFGARSAQHSRRTRVFPLAGTGDSVLQAPAREIVLSLTEEALHIRDAADRAAAATIPLVDIIAVEPLGRLSPLSSGGVGIVTKGAPVVLTGRSAHDDPAVVELRHRLDMAPPRRA
jgi:hypothetical protein